MQDQPVKTPRRPRADALRNRDRLLEAAKAVFSAGGKEASLEAVARHAGVGIGTLYRHFPTREALFEAVYRREVDHLADLAHELEAAASPSEALRRWLRSNVEFVATKKRHGRGPGARLQQQFGTVRLLFHPPDERGDLVAGPRGGRRRDPR